MTMLPDSQEFKDAMERCEKARKSHQFLASRTDGARCHICDERPLNEIHVRTIGDDLDSALSTIAELSKELNERYEKSIKDDHEITRHEKTIAALHKRVEGLEKIAASARDLASLSMAFTTRNREGLMRQEFHNLQQLLKASNPSGAAKGE